MKNIVEIAASNGNFNTLVKAVKAAGLVDALSGKGPFTVFAPTDDAFAKIPKENLEALLKDKNELKKVLLYHVVKGDVSSGQAKGLSEAKTLSGDNINFHNKGLIKRCFAVKDACITQPDIKASNGVIHVIDNVLIPG